MESRLFEDVHTVAEYSKEVDVVGVAETAPPVAAIEQGHREHPDGTTEEYQRIEFREQ